MAAAGGNETAAVVVEELALAPEIKDLQVLIGILVFWVFFIGLWFVQRRPKLVKNKAGILVKASDLEKEKITPFLYDTETGLHRVRSYAEFSARLGAPPVPSCSFQVVYSTSSRYQMYRHLASGALRKCARFVLICGAMAIMLSWWARSCQGVSEILKTNYFTREAVYGNMKAAHDVQSILLPLASVVIAFHVTMKLNRFNEIITKSWGIQGKIADLALLLSSATVPRGDRAVLAAKFRLYRYLNLAHFFLYQTVGVDYIDISLEELVKCGLLAPDEVDLVRKASTRRHTILLWIGATLRQLAAAGRMEPEILPRMQEVLRELRGLQDTLAKELSRVAPISFAQLMQLMVDMVMLLTPPALSYSLESKTEGITSYLWPALGSMVLAIFYQGGMRLVTAMEYPFGSDLDDLRCDWLLMSTERATFGFLTEAFPKQLAEG